jgi:ppGpp synthetase/RelA/SpoT-type nucleotidyltranferase
MKMRARGRAGMGEAAALVIAVNKLFRTEDEFGRPPPHVITVQDVTRGIVIDPVDQEKIQRLVTGSSAHFDQKSQTQRIFHARGRFIEALKHSYKHIDSDTRMELVRRAVAYWRRNDQTDYGKDPTIRWGKSMRLTLSKAMFIGPRGGKWADAKHTIPWKAEPSRRGRTALEEKPTAGERAREERAKAKAEREAYLKKMAGTVENFNAAIAGGKIEGTLAGHVVIAKNAIAAHKATLAALLIGLKQSAPPGAKIKTRVKTLESTLGKMVRKTKYKDAGKLQDLTGARIVCDSISEVKSTVESIKSKYKVIDEDDYIDTPAPGDYRSHHLIVEHAGIAKEIQVRTSNQNTMADWTHDIYKPRDEKQAAAVERYKAVLAAYSKQAADHFYSKDKGEDPPDPNMPPCTPVVKQTLGCL